MTHDLTTLPAIDFFAKAELPSHLAAIVALSSFMDANGCCIWTGRFEVGIPVVRGIKGQKSVRRLMFSGLTRNILLHPMCQNAKCINPDHAGISRSARPDYAQPRKSAVRGDMRFSSPLSAEQRLSIKAMSDQGLNQRRIAQQFGISQSTVSRVVRSL